MLNKKFFVLPLLIIIAVGLSTMTSSPTRQIPNVTIEEINQQAALSSWQSLSDDAFDNDIVELYTEFSAGVEEDPNLRNRWFWEQRAYPANKIPVKTHKAAVLTELNTKAKVTANNNLWRNLGPAPLNDITYAGSSQQDASGRTLSVVVHPNDSNTIFVGAAQGGIWKSTNAGQSFRPVSEYLPSLAIKVIRFAPSNPNIMYAGTGEPHSSTSIYGQGVLKSTDGGETWTQLPSSGSGWDFEYVAISGLQVHPTDPNIVFATTASIYTTVNHFNPASPPSVGIFKSTDGGTTWTLLKTATDYDFSAVSSGMDLNVGFMDLELAQNNPDLLYATEYFGGIYKSTDGGTTWNVITPFKSGGGADFPASVNDFTYFSRGQGLFFTMGRFTWSQILSSGGGAIPEFSRIEIGLAQSDPNVLYAGYAVDLLFLDPEGDGIPYTAANDVIQTSVGLLFKTTDGGSTWTWLGDWGRGGAPDYCASQCSYDNTVEVNPSNANDVMIGGSANYNQLWPVPIRPVVYTSDLPDYYLLLPWRGMINRSLDGGASWIDTTPHCASISSAPVDYYNGIPIYSCTSSVVNKVIHPDIHGLAYDPNNANKFYVSNDGGVYGATVNGNGTDSTHYTWANLNTGLATLQFYFFDSHPTDPNIIMGGLQDNSVAYWNGSTWEGWGFGDGAFGAFDPNSPQYVYMGTQYNIHRHDNGGTKTALDTNGNPANGWNLSIFGNSSVQEGDSVPFLIPFEIDPVSSNVVYAASNTGIYQSSNRGNSWGARQNANATNGTPTTISVSPVNNDYIWVGTSWGYVYLFDYSSGAATVTDLGTGVLPNRYITKIEASPNDADTVYVSYSGYNSNTFTPGKVFKSTNLGVTWTDISGNLPDVPVSALAIDPDYEDRLWAGSDVGVFMTEDGGTTWISERRNMPVVAIMDLKYNATTKYLMTATHGRGMWRLYNGPTANLSPAVGAPGSSFVVNGDNFPDGSSIIIDVNGTEVGTENSNADGDFTFTLVTDVAADEGVYRVGLTSGTNNVNLSYKLDATAQTYNTQAGNTHTVSTSIAGRNNPVYMPLVLKNFDPVFPNVPPAPTATPDPNATATPTASGPTATTDPNATATPTTDPNATATPTPNNPTATPDITLPTVINGDFESGGGVGWNEYSALGYPLIVSGGFPSGFTPHSGSFVAWLGYIDNETSIISQTFTIPSGAPIYLHYYYQIKSTDSCVGGVAYDKAYVYIDANEKNTYELCTDNITTDWLLDSIDMTSYGGQTVTISFVTITDSSFSSDFFIDDVSFQKTAAKKQNNFIGHTVPQESIQPKDTNIVPQLEKNQKKKP